ncbi:hypothetical protein [Bacillus sp. AFS017274]|nr:hypothetical protein [Bacillus sp. AFS017274]
MKSISYIHVLWGNPTHAIFHQKASKDDIPSKVKFLVMFTLVESVR